MSPLIRDRERIPHWTPSWRRPTWLGWLSLALGVTALVVAAGLFTGLIGSVPARTLEALVAVSWAWIGWESCYQYYDWKRRRAARR